MNNQSKRSTFNIVAREMLAFAETAALIVGTSAFMAATPFAAKNIALHYGLSENTALAIAIPSLLASIPIGCSALVWGLLKIYERDIEAPVMARAKARAMTLKK